MSPVLSVISIVIIRKVLSIVLVSPKPCEERLYRVKKGLYRQSLSIDETQVLGNSQHLPNMFLSQLD